MAKHFWEFITIEKTDNPGEINQFRPCNNTSSKHYKWKYKSLANNEGSTEIYSNIEKREKENSNLFSEV